MVTQVQGPGAGTATSPIIISGVQELRALKRTPRIARRGIQIAIAGVDSTEARTLGERITTFANECGCALGAKFMTTSFAAAVVWSVIFNGAFTRAFLWALPWTLLGAFAGAAAGKTIGILSARRRVRREIDQFIDSLMTEGD